jgi:hypothetical protein
MTYRSGDDLQLLDDLRAALKRWHRPTLGESNLATGLADIQRRQAADPWLTRSTALRQSIRAGLASLQERERAEEALLLERRYIRQEGITRLTEIYSLSERSIYHRLHEAHVALAHALWALEKDEAEPAPGDLPEPNTPRPHPHARPLPPQTYTRLLGVDEKLDRLLDYLNDPDGHWVISLDGMAGLGKTALAREAAGHVAETGRFQDIVWVTVRPVSYTSHGQMGPDLPILTCGQVLDAISSQLGGIDLGGTPLPAKQMRVRELLRDCSCLVVLDNMETMMDCGRLPHWLWEMTDPSKFLLTSRHWLAADVGQSVLSVEQLAESESLALIRHEAQLRGLHEVASATDDVLRPMLSVTGGNPLAIKLVVGQLVSLPLDHVLSSLGTAQPDSSSFYDYLFSTSWDLVGVLAQDLLLHMAQLPASRGNWAELTTISGLSEGELASAIESLTSHSLVQVSGFEVRSYCLHPLTFQFAMRQAAGRG